MYFWKQILLHCAEVPEWKVHLRWRCASLRPKLSFFLGQHCRETAVAASNRGTAEATTSECCTPGTNLSLKVIWITERKQRKTWRNTFLKWWCHGFHAIFDMIFGILSWELSHQPFNFKCIPTLMTRWWRSIQVVAFYHLSFVRRGLVLSCVVAGIWSCSWSHGGSESFKLPESNPAEFSAVFFSDFSEC